MSTYIFAQCGEHVLSYFERVLSAAKFYNKTYETKFNDISVTIRPESCIDDICTIWDLKQQIRQKGKYNG